MANESHFLAIDVGSSRVKLGWFPAAGACEGEKPATLPIAAERERQAELARPRVGGALEGESV